MTPEQLANAINGKLRPEDSLFLMPRGVREIDLLVANVARRHQNPPQPFHPAYIELADGSLLVAASNVLPEGRDPLLRPGECYFTIPVLTIPDTEWATK